MTLIKAERTENSTVELEFSVDRETFDKEVSNVYRKQAANITVPGFRKGKAPRSIIERMYGKGVFYEDAANNLLPAAYEEALKASETPVEPVGRAEFDIKSIDENGIVFTAVVPVKPAVTIEGYMGIEAQKVADEVTELEIENELKIVQEQNSREIDVTDAPAANGNTVVIDFDGSIDGVPFDGGKGEDYHLKLGSGSFIPGFEEQVVGMKAGEEKTIDLTFPEDYHAKDLAGQPVQFKVKCVEVKEKKVPAIDDEFAKDVSEFETLAEFKEDLKQKIVDRNMAQSEAKFRQALLAQLCEQVDIELPEAMVETQIDRLMDSYASRLEQQGISLELYLQYMQMSTDKLREDLKEAAVTQIKQQLALDAVVAAEEIVVSDEDVEEEVKKAAANLNVPYERVTEGLDREALKVDLARDRAMAAVAVAAKPNLIAADAEDGEIKLTEVTKDEEKAAEETEAKPKKRTTKAKAKTEETAEDGEEKKPAAKKPRAKKTTAEGEEAPKKTTTRKKKAEEPKGAMTSSPAYSTTGSSSCPRRSTIPQPALWWPSCCIWSPRTRIRISSSISTAQAVLSRREWPFMTPCSTSSAMSPPSALAWLPAWVPSFWPQGPRASGWRCPTRRS